MESNTCSKIFPLDDLEVLAERKQAEIVKIIADDYLRIFIRRFNLAEWDLVIQKAMSQASEGDRHARQWLTEMIDRLPSKKDENSSPKVRVAREVVERLVREVPAPAVDPGSSPTPR